MSKVLNKLSELSQSAQTQSAQTQSAQTQSAQTQSAQTQSAQTQSAQTQSAQTQSAQTQSAQKKKGTFFYRLIIAKESKDEFVRLFKPEEKPIVKRTKIDVKKLEEIRMKNPKLSLEEAFKQATKELKRRESLEEVEISVTVNGVTGKLKVTPYVYIYQRQK